MKNSPIQTTASPGSARQRIYAVGAVVGLLFGLISAHMFNRAGAAAAALLAGAALAFLGGRP